MAKDSSPSGRQLAASCDQNSKLEALQSFDDSKESEDGPDRSKTASAAHSKGDEGSNGDTELHIPTRSPSMNSIYGLYSNRRRNCILLAAAFASVVVPFSDTVYLPALPVSPRLQQHLCVVPPVLAPTACTHEPSATTRATTHTSLQHLCVVHQAHGMTKVVHARLAHTPSHSDPSSQCCPLCASHTPCASISHLQGSSTHRLTPADQPLQEPLPGLYRTSG